jgi:hypothetical protein
MADGHFKDVELLRRELAVLVLEWAGKSVKDDPDGPMSTALTRAVSEAARSAVAEQHQGLTVEAADRIADALERRSKVDGVVTLRLRFWSLGVIAIAGVALLAVAFLLGLQAGRTETPSPLEPAGIVAPVAPLAPGVETPAQAQPASREQTPQPVARPEKSTPRAAVQPVARSPTRELGRPARANDDAASRSIQPVGAASTPPIAQTPKP